MRMVAEQLQACHSLTCEADRCTIHRLHSEGRGCVQRCCLEWGQEHVHYHYVTSQLLIALCHTSAALPCAHRPTAYAGSSILFYALKYISALMCPPSNCLCWLFDLSIKRKIIVFSCPKGLFHALESNTLHQARFLWECYKLS